MALMEGWIGDLSKLLLKPSIDFQFSSQGISVSLLVLLKLKLN